MSTELTPTREQWLAERRNYITASNAAAALGVHPHKSRYALAAEMKGLIQPDDLSDNEAVKWGTILEGPVLLEYEQRTGREVTRWMEYTLLVDQHHSWLACTPDATQRIGANRGTVQIKTTSAFNAKYWRDEPPIHVQIQAQIEAFIWQADHCSIVALVGGQKLVWFDYKLNRPFIGAALPVLERFWTDLAEGKMPTPDGSEDAARALAKLYPEGNGKVVELDGRTAQLVDQLEDARRMKRAAELAEREAKNQLAALIGDASCGSLPDGRIISYTTQTRPETVCKASSFRVMRVRNPKEVENE